MTANPLVLMAAVHPPSAVKSLSTLHDDVRSRLLLVDNSAYGFSPGGVEVVRPEPHGADRVYEPACNLGVAGSFNVAARRLLDNPSITHLVWLSTSMRFHEPSGVDVLRACDALPLGFVSIPSSLHCFALGRDVIERVGLMDENYYPGYVDDTDYLRRMGLVGLFLPSIPIAGGVIQDGHAYDTLRSLNPAVTVINFEALKNYYRLKWGGSYEGNQERWSRPFGDEANDVSYWPPCTRAELIVRYGLGLP